MSIAGKRVIVIGDSHTDLYPFGERLEAGLKALGARVTVLAIGGSAASYWLAATRKEPWTRAAAMGKPARSHSLYDVEGQTFDLAIIALGTNDAANSEKESVQGRKPRGPIMNQAAQDIIRIGNKLAPKMIWVGPPKMTRVLKWWTNDAMDGMYTAMSRVFPIQNTIDSRTLVANPKGDGVHLTGASGREWGDAVVRRIDAMTRNMWASSGQGSELPYQEVQGDEDVAPPDTGVYEAPKTKTDTPAVVMWPLVIGVLMIAGVIASNMIAPERGTR